MSRARLPALALIRPQQAEWLRALVVSACAMALIAAGQAIPFHSLWF